MMAVYKLHEESICYRDLKPENVMLAAHGDNNTVKLIDFNTAKYINKFATYKTFTKVGTKIYQDPVINQCDEYCAFSADIWSAGILLYQLVTGSNEPHFGQEWESVSPICRNLIEKLLNTNAYKRPKAFQVLMHPFIKMSVQEYADYLG